MHRCDTCSTPLQDDGLCVTCEAEAEGLAQLTRSGYASVREVMGLLEGEGLAPEMEKVPPGRPEEAHHPLWNLYVPRDQVERAQAFLRRDWSGLLDDPEAAAAAERGLAGIDLDAGGEVDCPACGHRFAAQGSAVECPECGLALGAPTDASPDENR
jgi:hypothetical protein